MHGFWMFGRAHYQEGLHEALSSIEERLESASTEDERNLLLAELEALEKEVANFQKHGKRLIF